MAPRNSFRPRRAATLIEVVIALIVVSLLALSIAAMLAAVSYGTDMRRDVRRVAVRTQQVRLRLDDAVRTSHEILAVGRTSAGHGYLVLWRGDTNAPDRRNPQKDFSELMLIERAENSTVLMAYTKAAAVPDQVVAGNYYSFLQTAKQNNQLAGSTWAEKISGFEIVPDAADPANARLVSWRLTLEADDLDLAEALVGCVARRAHGTL